MAGKKLDNFTTNWFIEKGYTYDAQTSSWKPPLIKKGFIGEKKGFRQKDNTDVIKKPQIVVGDVKLTDSTSISLPQHSVLVIDGLIAGLNGSKGLMRSHWSNTKKQKELYQTIILQHLKEGKVRNHIGEVTVEYIGYKNRFMDWDNFCSSFKHIGDALVKMKIIADDSPRIVTQFIPNQIKVKQIEQKVVIIIKDK